MELVTVWVLSVQLWLEPEEKIKLVYTKEYTSYEECMQNREVWAEKKFRSFCLIKTKIQ